MATILNKPKLDQKEKPELQKPTFGSAPGATPSATPAAQGQQTGPAKSGGFTNLSSYLQANKQAGTKIAGKIGEGVQKDVGQKKETATTEADQFRQAVEASKGNVAQGQQFLQQITPGAPQAQAQGQTPGPVNVIDTTNITSDPNLLAQFTGLRTGATQAAAQAAQNKEQQEALSAAQNLGQTYGTRAQQLAQGNRYDLLKEFLANPKASYGKGLSTLDNAFLARDKSKALETVKKGLQQEATQETKSRADLLGKLGAEGTSTIEAGQKVAKDIQSQADKNISEYNKAFQESAASVNAARAAEQEWARQQYKNLQEGKPIEQKFADMMGLTQGQNIADIIKRSDVSSYLGFGPTDVTSGLQAATPEQLARMGSIYQLAGQTFTAPEQIAAALQSTAQFDPTKVKSSQQAMLDAFFGNTSNAYVDKLGGAVRDDVRQILDKNQYQNLLNTLGQNIYNRDYVSNLLQAKNTLYDQRTAEQNAMMNQLRNYSNVLGVDTDRGTLDLLNRLQNYINTQGFYNTVNIATPNDRSMDQITRPIVGRT